MLRMNVTLESDRRALPRALEVAGDALRERNDKAFTSYGECVTQENRPEAPLTPEKRIDKDQPPTPTMNLKVLASAASSDIRDREQNTRKSLNFSQADYDKQVDDKPSSSVGRKSKSLGLLCTKFLARYDLPEKQNTEICLDEIASSLKVERRRVYDIINVLESLEIVVRLAKNRYRWQGRGHLEPTLAKLKRLSEPPMMDQENVPQSDDGGTPQREKSLGILSQKFIMLFLVEADKPVYLEDAARLLIGTQEQDAAKCKTKVRRLYDIANILTSLGLVEKMYVQLPSPQGKKPAFKWIGPNVEEAQKRYQVVDFNSESSAVNTSVVSPSLDIPIAPPTKRRRVSSKHSLLDNMKVIQMPNHDEARPRATSSPISRWKSMDFPSTIDDEVGPAVTGLIRLKMRRVQSYDAGAPSILPAMPQRQPSLPQSPGSADSFMASLVPVAVSSVTSQSDPMPMLSSSPASPWASQYSTDQLSSDSSFGFGLLSPLSFNLPTPQSDRHPPPSSWVQSSAAASGTSSDNGSVSSPSIFNFAGIVSPPPASTLSIAGTFSTPSSTTSIVANTLSSLASHSTTVSSSSHSASNSTDVGSISLPPVSTSSVADAPSSPPASNSTIASTISSPPTSNPTISSPPSAQKKPMCRHLIACMAPCPGGHSEDVSCFDIIGENKNDNSDPKSPTRQNGKVSKVRDEMPPHMTVVYELCQSASTSVGSLPGKTQSAFLVQRQHLHDLLAAKNLSPSKVSEEPYYVVRPSARPSSGEKHLISALEEARPVASGE